MYIAPVFSSNIGRSNCLNHTKRVNHNANFLNNTIQDTVTFCANDNVDSATPANKMSLAKDLIVSKGYEYRTEIRNATNRARGIIADVLEENGFDSEKFETGWNKGSKMDNKFMKFFNDSRIKTEHICLDEDESSNLNTKGKIFDVITLPSKKHPDVTVKISRQVAERYYYDGWHDPEFNYYANILYEDKNLELTGADWTNNCLKAKDGTELVFTYRLPEKKCKQMFGLGKDIECFELRKKPEEMIPENRDWQSEGKYSDNCGHPYTIHAGDFKYEFKYPNAGAPILKSVTLEVDNTPTPDFMERVFNGLGIPYKVVK